MNHDPHGSNRHSTTGTGPREFADAVPRGSILRNSEPVVSPVVTPPVSGGAASGAGATTTATSTASNSTIDGGTSRLDASSRRTIDHPAAAPVDPPVGHYGAREVGGVPAKRFSIGATFLGWAVASFFSLLFTIAVLALIGGGVAGVGGDEPGIVGGDPAALGFLTFAGIVLGMFLAYLVGGYAAGRIAHWDGAKHGALVPAWTILFSLLALALGAYFGTAYLTASGIFVPRIDASSLTTYGILGLLLTLAAMFGGAILGGILGARHDQSYEGDPLTSRPQGRLRRGRPL